MALLSGVMESVCPFIKFLQEEFQIRSDLGLQRNGFGAVFFCGRLQRTIKIGVKETGTCERNFFHRFPFLRPFFGMSGCVKCAHRHKARDEKFFRSFYLRFLTKKIKGDMQYY